MAKVPTSLYKTPDDGVMTPLSTAFGRCGKVFETRTRKLSAGFTCATHDLDIHCLANRQSAGADLITLHLYSPPLLVMGQYSLEDSTMRDFNDDVHVFVEGAGI